MADSSSQSLRRSEDIVVQLDDVEENSGSFVQRSLVGKVLSDKGLNRGAIKTSVQGWGKPKMGESFRTRYKSLSLYFSR